MKTLENAKRSLRRTMGSVMAVAAFSAMAITTSPAQANDASTALYHSESVQQTNGQNAGRLVKTDLSIGINLGHIFRHRNDRHRRSDSHSRRNESHNGGRSRHNNRSSEGYYYEGRKPPRRSLRNGSSYRNGHSYRNDRSYRDGRSYRDRRH